MNACFLHRFALSPPPRGPVASFLQFPVMNGVIFVCECGLLLLACACVVPVVLFVYVGVGVCVRCFFASAIFLSGYIYYGCC